MENIDKTTNLQEIASEDEDPSTKVVYTLQKTINQEFLSPNQIFKAKCNYNSSFSCCCRKTSYFVLRNHLAQILGLENATCFDYKISNQPEARATSRPYIDVFNNYGNQKKLHANYRGYLTSYPDEPRNSLSTDLQRITLETPNWTKPNLHSKLTLKQKQLFIKGEQNQNEQSDENYDFSKGNLALEERINVLDRLIFIPIQKDEDDTFKKTLASDPERAKQVLLYLSEFITLAVNKLIVISKDINTSRFERFLINSIITDACPEISKIYSLEGNYAFDEKFISKLPEMCYNLKLLTDKINFCFQQHSVYTSFQSTTFELLELPFFKINLSSREHTESITNVNGLNFYPEALEKFLPSARTNIKEPVSLALKLQNFLLINPNRIANVEKMYYDAREILLSISALMTKKQTVAEMAFLKIFESDIVSIFSDTPIQTDSEFKSLYRKISKLSDSFKKQIKKVDVQDPIKVITNLKNFNFEKIEELFEATCKSLSSKKKALRINIPLITPTNICTDSAFSDVIKALIEKGIIKFTDFKQWLIDSEDAKKTCISELTTCNSISEKTEEKLGVADFGMQKLIIQYVESILARSLDPKKYIAFKNVISNKANEKYEELCDMVSGASIDENGNISCVNKNLISDPEQNQTKSNKIKVFSADEIKKIFDAGLFAIVRNIPDDAFANSFIDEDEQTFLQSATKNKLPDAIYTIIKIMEDKVNVVLSTLDFLLNENKTGYNNNNIYNNFLTISKKDQEEIKKLYIEVSSALNATCEEIAQFIQKNKPINAKSILNFFKNNVETNIDTIIKLCKNGNFDPIIVPNQRSY